MKYFISLFMLWFAIATHAQKPVTAVPHESDRQLTEKHIRYLASDELKGRRVMSEGIVHAGTYIADQFSILGLKPLGGNQTYYQKVPLKVSLPAENGTMTVGNESFELGKNMVILNGKALDLNQQDAVFAGHGWIDETQKHDDYANLDVKGKIVFVLPGTPESSSPMAVFEAMSSKREWANERGALAVVELYRISGFPFQFFMNYFNKEQITLNKDGGKKTEDITYAFIKEENLENINALKSEGTFKVDFSHTGVQGTNSECQNVLGFLPGTDPELSNEYILVSAHYDHVGVGAQGGSAYSEADSIFNGARDNAIGISAMLRTAKYFSENPSKRPVIFAAVTAEEVGLLGSKYLADYPPVSLDQIIYNINTDGAGYNNKNAIAVIGFGRTGVDDLILKSSKTENLEVFPNPVPQQNLFDRSDNVSFAAKGIPAICISPGATSFDAEIMKYYHQVADNPETLDYDYVFKYAEVFAKTAHLIANWSQKPFWVEGDKYEAAGKELYGLE